jgi:hypothetical protein
VAILTKTDELRSTHDDKIKARRRYDEIMEQQIASSIPTGWRVLEVLLCTLVALGAAFLFVSHFEHY